MLTHKRMKVLETRRAKAGLRGKLFEKSMKDLPFFICSSVMELEYPHIPPANVVFPGPILIPVPPLSGSTYPDLASFLDRNRTIVINLGSNFQYTTADVVAVVDAILDAQDRCSWKGGFQVLWKLNQKKKFEDILERNLSTGPERNMVRVEEWIEPPTLAVLQHPGVVAFVNHGGASESPESFGTPEGTHMPIQIRFTRLLSTSDCQLRQLPLMSLILGSYSAGVPQIILPQWLDLYEYAVRTEWLGHGIYANKGRPAEIDALQLADAFVRVLADEPGEEGALLRAKAREIAEACKRGGGVDTVAETLLDHATNPRTHYVKM